MTTVITPTRSDNFYIGFAKEVTPGTPVAPSIFPRWMDGTSLETDVKTEVVKEGDSTRRRSIVIKNGQVVKIKLTAWLRANELGFFETAALGASSDTYTAPSVSTTLSANTSAGATSVTTAANTGLTGSSVIPLVIAAGTSKEEIALFAPPVTGSGPYTLAVSGTYNGGNGLRFSHTSGDTVQSAANHVITDQQDGNYYTIECGIGSLFSGPGATLRVRDCKVDTCKRSAKKGTMLLHEIEFVGIASTVQMSAATVTLEQHQGFLFTQSSWTLDGSTSGDAPNLNEFAVEQKNNLDVDIQTEALTLAAIIFGGDLQITANYALVFTAAARLFQMYFGSSTGTTDSQTLFLGSLLVTFTQPDTLQSVTYSILTLAYEKIPWPVAKKDGKAWNLTVDGESVAAPLSGAGPNNPYLLQATINNTQYSAY